MEQVTGTIARFVCDTEYAGISHEAIEAAKLHILDTLGVLMAGSRERIAGIVGKYIQSLGCKEESTLITRGVRTSGQYAAFGNGVMAHVLDYDDYEWPSMAHSSVTALPPVLALGEKLQKSGKECLTAYLVGMEVISRVGKGIHPSHYNKGWHSTCTLGTLGAASASSRVLGLDPEKIAVALGIAASMSSGLRGNFGTMTKAFHAGHASKNGIESAILASLGLSASKTILEGDLGFCRIFTEGDRYDLQEITTGLGSPFSIVSPGIGKKLYPSCAATHSFLDGIFHLIQQFDIQANDVDSVECGIFYLLPKMLIHSNPQTGLEGKFSLEFCIALALQERSATLSQFADSKVRDPHIQNLMKKIKKSVTEEAGGEGTEYPDAIIKVKMRDGKSYSYKGGTRKGSPATPLTTDEVVNKFFDCAQLAYPREKVSQILEMIMRIEKIDDISELVLLIR